MPKLSTERRHRLADDILELGYEAMPCSRCKKQKLDCHMLDENSKCAECVRAARPCDGTHEPLSSGEVPGIPLVVLFVLMWFFRQSYYF